MKFACRRRVARLATPTGDSLFDLRGDHHTTLQWVLLLSRYRPNDWFTRFSLQNQRRMSSSEQSSSTTTPFAVALPQTNVSRIAQAHNHRERNDGAFAPRSAPRCRISSSLPGDDVVREHDVHGSESHRGPPRRCDPQAAPVEGSKLRRSSPVTASDDYPVCGGGCRCRAAVPSRLQCSIVVQGLCSRHRFLGVGRGFYVGRERQDSRRNLSHCLRENDQIARHVLTHVFD